MRENRELELGGELREIRRLLDGILCALIAPYGLISELIPLAVAAGVATDKDLKRHAEGGVWIQNRADDTVFVGFAPGTGTSARGLVQVAAGADVTIPYACSFVSVGGPAADGTVIVAPLLGPAGPGQ